MDDAKQSLAQLLFHQAGDVPADLATAIALVNDEIVPMLVIQRRAGQALYVLDHFDQAITTLLIGTNILHLTIATIVTVAVQRVWGMWAVTAATLVTTVVVFFAGEMLPKSIAKKYAERLAMATARSLRFFMVLFQPLSVLLTAIGIF